MLIVSYFKLEIINLLFVEKLLFKIYNNPLAELINR